MTVIRCKIKCAEVISVLPVYVYIEWLITVAILIYNVSEMVYLTISRVIPLTVQIKLRLDPEQSIIEICSILFMAYALLAFCRRVDVHRSKSYCDGTKVWTSTFKSD